MRKFVLALTIVVSSLFAITNEEVAIKADKVTDGFISSKAKMTIVTIVSINVNPRIKVRELN